MRTERWKLIYTAGLRERRDGFTTGRPPSGRVVRLYDLETDPDETTRLADRPELAPRVAELTRELAARLKRTARQPDRAPAGGDVHDVLKSCLPSRDWAEPARK